MEVIELVLCADSLLRNIRIPGFLVTFPDSFTKTESETEFLQKTESAFTKTEDLEKNEA